MYRIDALFCYFYVFNQRQCKITIIQDFDAFCILDYSCVQQSTLIYSPQVNKI